MRILVLSDTHGSPMKIRQAIEEQPEAAVLYHLGDGERDMDCCRNIAQSMKVIQVRGNCDFGSDLPAFQFNTIGGKRIYATHGHLENVKYTAMVLKEKCRTYHADILLYGHTHTAVTEYEDGSYYFNPGSLRDGHYGVVDITSAGIVCVPMRLRY